MTAIARKGLDLYIERDGQWVYAGFGWPKGDNHDSALVEYMDEGEKTCLVYLPLWDEVLSLELGIDGDSRIEAVPNPFRHRIVVLGSSITPRRFGRASRHDLDGAAGPPDGTRFPESRLQRAMQAATRIRADAGRDGCRRLCFRRLLQPERRGDRGAARRLRGDRPQGASLDAADLHSDRGPARP